MERYSSNNKRQAAPVAQQAAGAAQETFSEMANVTAQRSGVVGKLLVISLIIVSIAVTAFVGFAVLRSVDGNNNVNADQYQAVFLSDGQIYFGKLNESNDSYAVLSDIFYLQVEQQVQPVQGEETAGEQSQAKISLAKLGKELHGPEDEMFINRDQILFWENLKEDGQVVTAITEFKKDGGANTTTPDLNSGSSGAGQSDDSNADSSSN